MQERLRAILKRYGPACEKEKRFTLDEFCLVNRSRAGQVRGAVERAVAVIEGRKPIALFPMLCRSVLVSQYSFHLRPRFAVIP